MLANQIIKDYTTFKIGGAVRYLSVCKSIEDLLEALTWCNGQGLPWFILGNGSNILVSDDGFPGLVIKLGGRFKKVKFDENTVEVGAGVFLPVLSQRFLEMQWGGFEFMCDIPGTIGGALRLNAGTKQGEIKDHFISAMILTTGGEVKSICKEEMGFAYRHSSFSETRDIALSALFSLPFLEDRESILEKRKRIILGRRQKQPRNRRNCGSVFKSFPGQKPAGWYIDRAGLKGTRMGDAMVAYEHANWIVNLGNAKAEHVKSLIEKIQNEVFRKFDITLERELIFVPEDIL